MPPGYGFMWYSLIDQGVNFFIRSDDTTASTSGTTKIINNSRGLNIFTKDGVDSLSIAIGQVTATNFHSAGNISATGNLSAGATLTTSGNVQIGQHLVGNGPKPILSACGRGATLTSTASDIHGSIIEGSTATGCTLIFATAFATAPDCVVSSPTGSALTSYSTSPTALKLVNASATGDKFSYICAQ